MNQYLGPFLLILTNLCYMVSHTLAKYLAAFIPISQLMAIRFIFGPLILLPLVYTKFISFKVHNWPLMLLRTGFGIMAMFAYIWAIKYGDAGKVTLIFQSSTLWGYILARIWLKETPSIQTKVMVPVAFVGLLLVIQPTSIGSFSASDLVAIFASFLNAGVLLSLKVLRNDHDSASILIVNYGLSAIVMSFISVPTFVVPDPNIFLWLLLFGLSGFIGNYMMTVGFKYTSASVAGNLLLLIVPLMYISGIIFFDEVLNMTSALGVVLMLFSLGVIARHQ